MEQASALRAAVVTISDSVSRGTRMDKSGDAATKILSDAGIEVTVREVIPDERQTIATTLRQLCNSGSIECIVTTGGTGVGPRDVTPEATQDVIDKELPGIGEAMRAEGRKSTPFAVLSRQVVGVRGTTLIVNTPGSEAGVRESLSVVLPVLAHTVDLISGRTEHKSNQSGAN